MRELLEQLKKLKELAEKREKEIRRSVPRVYDDKDVYEANVLRYSKIKDKLNTDSEYQKILIAINDVERAIHEQFNGLNLQSYGRVNDKATAIKLLCQTTFAWDILDESLKNDPEVIMYYQPLGYRHLEYGDGYIAEMGICEIVGHETLCQDGFEVFHDGHSLKEAGLISDEMYQQSIDNKFFKPEIRFPEGFDYEGYFRIQAELSRNCLDNLHIRFEANSVFAESNPESAYLPKSAFLRSDSTYVYDRSLLPTIVQKYYTESLGQRSPSK